MTPPQEPALTAACPCDLSGSLPYVVCADPRLPAQSAEPVGGSVPRHRLPLDAPLYPQTVLAPDPPPPRFLS